MNVETMDLPYLAMETEAFARDPYPFLAEARAKHPWLARGAFGYVIHEYAAIQDVLRQDGPLQSDYAGIVEMMGAQGTPWGDWTERHLLSAQGTAHRRIRDASGVQVHAAAGQPATATLMRKVLSRLLDEWVPKGRSISRSLPPISRSACCAPLSELAPRWCPDCAPRSRRWACRPACRRSICRPCRKSFIQLDAFVQDLVARRRGGEDPRRTRHARRPDRDRATTAT